MNAETRVGLLRPERKEFANKVVAITGGASGIGQAIAQAFKKEHAHVVVIDVGKKPDFLPDQQFIHADVSDWNAVNSAVEDMVKHYGDLNIVINNAAIKVGGTILDVSSEDMEKLLRVNALGMWNVAKATLPHLIKSYGTLINVCSGTSESLPPHRDAYFASKGLSYSLTHALAASFKDSGVRIVGIAPGPVDTPLWRVGQTEEEISSAIAGKAGPHVVQPEDVAKEVLSLASYNNASFLGKIYKM